MKSVDTVYVIGAGFSAGCGYPLTKSLLVDLLGRFSQKDRKNIEAIIKFHHPSFDSNDKDSFPNIEQLLTEMDVNKKMFEMSRSEVGNFTSDKLDELRSLMLREIGKWFHDLYKQSSKNQWLTIFENLVQEENTAIISFNWDLILDHKLLKNLDANSYGVTPHINTYPVLLKPHGSLNWFLTEKLSRVNDEKHNSIYSGKGDKISAFIHPRKIKSKKREYDPIIVPPTFLKDFEKDSIFKNLWINCTHVLSTANKIVFLGYSMPEADMHAKFIFRCGFHNQIEGIPTKLGKRLTPPTKPAEVIIVNPDTEAADRIEAIAGPNIPCTRFPITIVEWLSKSTIV